MDDTSTLADIFSGALGGYIDSQNNQPITATALTPSTAYGYAGYAQATPATPITSALGSNPTLIIIGVAVVAAVLLLRK